MYIIIQRERERESECCISGVSEARQWWTENKRRLKKTYDGGVSCHCLWMTESLSLAALGALGVLRCPWWHGGNMVARWCSGMVLWGDSAFVCTGGRLKAAGVGGKGPLRHATDRKETLWLGQCGSYDVLRFFLWNTLSYQVTRVSSVKEMIECVFHWLQFICMFIGMYLMQFVVSEGRICIFMTH